MPLYTLQAVSPSLTISIVFPATATATYDYGYGRTTQTYDTSKTYYQQAGATGYTSAPTAYDTSAAGAPKVINFQPATQATYGGQPTRTTIQTAKAGAQYTGQPTAYVPQTTGYSHSVNTVNNAPKSAATAQAVGQSANYSGYETALYSAASMYVAQQQNSKPTNIGGQQGTGGGWQG